MRLFRRAIDFDLRYTIALGLSTRLGVLFYCIWGVAVSLHLSSTLLVSAESLSYIATSLRVPRRCQDNLLMKQLLRLDSVYLTNV